MTDTIRLGILKAFTDYLTQTVRLENGYTHDLSRSVFRGRAWYSDRDPLPMVSILEAPVPDPNPQTAGYGRGMQLDKWVLLFQGWADDDMVNPTDPGHMLLGDVKMALGRLRVMLANGTYAGTNNAFENVGQMEIEAGVVRPPDGQVSEHAFFWMRVVVEVTERVDQPFLT